MNPYTIIFHNSFSSSLLIAIFNSDYAWFAARLFGGYDLLAITLAAVLGGTLAMAVNMGAGYALSLTKLYRRNESVCRRALAIFQKYFVYLLLLPQIHLAALAALVGGFLRAPVWKIVGLAALGRVIYYGYYLLH